MTYKRANLPHSGKKMGFVPTSKKPVGLTQKSVESTGFFAISSVVFLYNGVAF